MAAAIRQQRINRETGALIQLIDARLSDAFDEDEGGRWVTWCATHETFCQHPVLEDARYWAAHPTMWCGLCAEGMD